MVTFFENLSIVFGDDLNTLDTILLTSSVQNKRICLDLEFFGTCLGVPTSDQILWQCYIPTDLEGFNKVESFLDIVHISQQVVVTQKNPTS